VPDTVEFGGEQFVVADAIGVMPLMRFAHVAKSGTDSSDLDGLAAMYDLIEACIAPQDWDRFQRVAIKAKADDKDLFAVVREVMAMVSGRPTRRPSDSSDGPATTPPKSESEDEPTLRLVHDLEAKGRADKAEFVVMAMREKARSAG
jgi:hypothetical protein